MAREILAFILTTSGWVLVSSTLPTDYWKVSSIDGTVITTATFWSNLWKTCVTDSTGVSNCKDFPSMLALDGQTRLFLCDVCVLVCLHACILSLLLLKPVNNEQFKKCYGGKIWLINQMYVHLWDFYPDGQIFRCIEAPALWIILDHAGEHGLQIFFMSLQCCRSQSLIRLHLKLNLYSDSNANNKWVCNAFIQNTFSSNFRHHYPTVYMYYSLHFNII